jgi:hypothetical protein
MRVASATQGFCRSRSESTRVPEKGKRPCLHKVAFFAQFGKFFGAAPPFVDLWQILISPIIMESGADVAMGCCPGVSEFRF